MQQAYQYQTGDWVKFEDAEVIETDARELRECLNASMIREDAAQSELVELRNEIGQVKGEYDRAVNKVDALREELEIARSVMASQGETISRVVSERDGAQAELDKFDGAMRALACNLGAGGYNAESLTANQLASKVQWGIDNLLKVEQQRLTVAEQRNSELRQELATMHAIKEVPGENVLWDVLNATVGVITRRAYPHALESEAHNAGAKVILDRRAGLTATHLTQPTESGASE
jgi:chromosome segregation ATPase